ncbi:thaumatin-like protein, partial [Tanacetum coccineum]
CPTSVHIRHFDTAKAKVANRILMMVVSSEPLTIMENKRTKRMAWPHMGSNWDGEPPASLAEFNLDSPLDFYDVSLTDGFNMPISIFPYDDSGVCPSIRCDTDLNLHCPPNLMVRGDRGETVACKSGCTAFQTPEHYAAVFTLQNICEKTIWPGIQPSGGRPVLMEGGLELRHQESIFVTTPTGWSGRFWARTGCTFNANGEGTCETGDCGSGLYCRGAGDQLL